MSTENKKNIPKWVPRQRDYVLENRKLLVKFRRTQVHPLISQEEEKRIEREEKKKKNKGT